MSSLRSRSQSRTRNGAGLATRRMGGVIETSHEDFPPSLTNVVRREVETSRVVPPQSKVQSRIPQNPTLRKPPTSTSRPPLTHETNSWSTTTANAGRSIPIGTATSRDGNAGLVKPRPVLRRKQSIVTAEIAGIAEHSRSSSGRTGSSSSVPRSQTSRNGSISDLDRSFTESPVEIQIAQKIEIPYAVTEGTTIYPELDRYRNIRLPRDEPTSELLFRLATHDLPPPTPLFSGASSHSQLSVLSGSPSTRFSESPGGGAYSRDTTPTSMSSASPGLFIPIRNAARAKQVTPVETRPPVTRRRTGSISKENDDIHAGRQGLAAVTEALTSSSSSSTVREAERKDKKKKAVLPPNPPPRKSSQKLKKNIRDDSSPSKSSKKPARPVMRSPSPIKSPSTKPLSTQRSVTAPLARPTPPPSRPSREGTPDLYSHFGGPVPVIQSNLAPTNVSERRYSNQFTSSSLPRSITPSSAREQYSQARLPAAREPTPTPKLSSTSLPQVSKADNGRTTRTPSPSISTFKSKFGIFSRRKTDSDAVERKDRSTRKGPAAGTGHEGYGKIGAVRRRSSSTANAAHGLPMRSSSSDSLASTQSTDPFFLARLNPVVIAGGEVVENRNTGAEISRTESNQSLSRARPSADTRNGSSLSLSSREERKTLWPSAIPRDSSRSRRPSDNSDSEVTMKSTLAFRRSVQRLRNSPDQKPLSLPKPINTKGAASPSLASNDTIFTDDSLALSDFQLAPPKIITAPKKLTKRAKSPRKWNIFGRSQPKAAKNEIEVPVAAAVEIKPSRPVAFYTIMDSSDQEDSEEKDLGDILLDAEVSLSSSLLPQPHFQSNHERQPSASSQHSLSRSTPTPVLATTNQNMSTHTQRATDVAHPQSTTFIEQTGPEVEQLPVHKVIGKPSRLPQVGRIPKVINTRPEGTSPKSFSRPFNRISLQLPPPPQPIQVDCESVAQGPSPPATSTPELLQDVSTVTTGASSPPNMIKHRQSRSLDIGRPGKEFLAFSPRKGSECTTSSSSSSSGIASFALHTAVVPPPTAPLAEDEIWDEYNDLLGEVPPSATSSKGVPFHLETYGSRLAKKVTASPESPTVHVHPIKEPVKDVRESIKTEKSTSSHFSADMTARINAAFRFDSDPPTTPFSVSEFVSGYGERNNSIEPAQVSTSSQRSSTGSVKSRQPRASGSSVASEETPLSQVNLRVGSMTVSKWLTFGHVLFSPARDELIPVVGSLKRHSILVIDGLGNDDWSFYAAETYPAATFFNLSPRAPLSQEHRTTTQFPLSPPNHHQIQYTSHMDKFPFGAESFTTVVFRFPAAAPESHYRNIIAEARRVLKPGGYVELSILDVDLNNMGSRARRGVRRLKERVSIQQPEINLSSTADLMLRLLGNQGFTDVKTCRVGVPVASAIANSSSEEGHQRKKTKDERSLAEMMSDETDKGDENITKMVAKVGRWWYNRLYETPTGSSNSMWNDRALLAECEEWKTSLKLMVCHAKVPETRSRLASI